MDLLEPDVFLVGEDDPFMMAGGEATSAAIVGKGPELVVWTRRMWDGCCGEEDVHSQVVCTTIRADFYFERQRTGSEDRTG